MIATKNKLRMLQIAATGLWLLASGGWAIQRELGIDPIIEKGRRCVINAPGDAYQALNGSTNPFVDAYNQVLLPQCSEASVQAITDLRLHPVASIAGALLPSVALAPLAYFGAGWVARRRATQHKVCEHCAETIKAAAKVCRYCGRDV